MKKARKLPLFGNIRVLCVSALLCGISIVLAWVCKTYLTLVFLGSGVRITFENLPIILSGLWFGPWVGASVGFAADFISTALSQYGLGGINPLITLGATMCGMTAGLISRYVCRRESVGQSVLAVFASHAVGSGLCKTLGLYLYHFYVAVTWGDVTFSSLWLRLPTYLFIAAVECVICIILQKNGALKRQIERMVHA